MESKEDAGYQDRMNALGAARIRAIGETLGRLAQEVPAGDAEASLEHIIASTAALVAWTHYYLDHLPPSSRKEIIAAGHGIREDVLPPVTWFEWNSEEKPEGEQ